MPVGQKNIFFGAKTGVGLWSAQFFSFKGNDPRAGTPQQREVPKNV